MYELHGVLFLSGDGKVKVGFDIPGNGSGDMKLTMLVWKDDANMVAGDILKVDNAQSDEISVSSSQDLMMVVRGLVETAGTAGDLTFRWRQTQSGKTATVEKHSYIRLTRIE